MTMTYKTVTGQITQPGSNIGIRARVIATPLTTSAALTFTGDDRISVGPQTAVTDAAGNLGTLKIPTNVDLPELYWRITAQALDKAPGVPEAWTIKTAVVVTGTGTVLLKDLLEVDTLAVSTDFLVNISDLVTDAENAAADAEGSQIAAETAQTAATGSATAAAGSATAAAGSASTASSAATTATTKAGEAASSATAAAGSASAAATSATNAAASQSAAATSESNAAASKTAAQGYAAAAAGSVSLVAWAPSTVYAAGDVRQAPDGSSIRRLANGTSGASFDSTEEAAWEAVLGNGTTIDGKALTASIDARLSSYVTDNGDGTLSFAGVGVTDNGDGTITFG